MTGHAYQSFGAVPLSGQAEAKISCGDGRPPTPFGHRL